VLQKFLPHKNGVLVLTVESKTTLFERSNSSREFVNIENPAEQIQWSNQVYEMGAWTISDDTGCKWASFEPTLCPPEEWSRCPSDPRLEIDMLESENDVKLEKEQVPESGVLESQHPYRSNSDQTRVVNPECKKVFVTFKYQTEFSFGCSV